MALTYNCHREAACRDDPPARGRAAAIGQSNPSRIPTIQPFHSAPDGLSRSASCRHRLSQSPAAALLQYRPPPAVPPPPGTSPRRQPHRCPAVRARQAVSNRRPHTTGRIESWPSSSFAPPSQSPRTIFVTVAFLARPPINPNSARQSPVAWSILSKVPPPCLAERLLCATADEVEIHRSIIPLPARLPGTFFLSATPGLLQPRPARRTALALAKKINHRPAVALAPFVKNLASALSALLPALHVRHRSFSKTYRPGWS